MLYHRGSDFFSEPATIQCHKCKVHKQSTELLCVAYVREETETMYKCDWFVICDSCAFGYLTQSNYINEWNTGGGEIGQDGSLSLRNKAH